MLILTYQNYLEVIKSRSDDLEIGMTKDEFDSVIAENENLPTVLRKELKYLPLIWKCKNKNHEKFKNSYHNIKYKNQGCPKCFDESRRISYQKYLNLIAKRKDDLDVGMTEAEFNDALKKNDDSEFRVKPNAVKLKWFCKLGNHIFYAPYNRVKKGQTCNKCSKTTYEDYIRLIRSRKDLKIGMTEIEFNSAMENNNRQPRGLRKPPSHVIMKWKCIKGNHIFYAHYYIIKEGGRCGECRKISYKNYLNLLNVRADLAIGMTEQEFDIIMMENKDLPKNLRKKPSQVGLVWNCNINTTHPPWRQGYSTIKQGVGCPACHPYHSLTYEDYIKTVKNRPDLVLELKEEQFNEIMLKNDLLPNNERKTHSMVKLPWRCKKDHVWYASHHNVGNKGSGCLICGDRIAAIGSLIHPIIEYYSNLLLIKYNCIVKVEEYASDQRYHKIDLIVTRNLDFKEKIEQNQTIIPFFDSEIDQIGIDFTFSLTYNHILIKFFKQYQTERRFLIIVMIRENKYQNAQEFMVDIREDQTIKYRQNIKIINFEEFLEFLNLKQDISHWDKISEMKLNVASKLQDLRKMAIEAVDSDEKLEELSDFSDKIKIILSEGTNNLFIDK